MELSQVPTRDCGYLFKVSDGPHWAKTLWAELIRTRAAQCGITAGKMALCCSRNWHQWAINKFHTKLASSPVWPLHSSLDYREWLKYLNCWRLTDNSLFTYSEPWSTRWLFRHTNMLYKTEHVLASWASELWSNTVSGGFLFSCWKEISFFPQKDTLIYTNA